MLHASSSGNVYPLAVSESSPSAFATLLDPATFWHHRLGHYGARILSSLLTRNLISFPNKFHDFCSLCRLAKSHKLPCQLVEHCCQKPVELIHADLWQSPILSNIGYRYYICFKDDFSRYTWVYPLKQKTEILSTFCAFQKLVENLFNSKIKMFQSDGWL